MKANYFKNRVPFTSVETSYRVRWGPYVFYKLQIISMTRNLVRALIHL